MKNNSMSNLEYDCTSTVLCHCKFAFAAEFLKFFPTYWPGPPFPWRTTNFPKVNHNCPYNWNKNKFCSQHPPTQCNMKGGRWNSTIKKPPLKEIFDGKSQHFVYTKMFVQIIQTFPFSEIFQLLPYSRKFSQERRVYTFF